MLLATAWSRASAASVSEPDTVLYGRIVQHVGNREYWATNGVLVWTLKATAPTPRVQRFTTRLRPLGDGRFSYSLRLPHQLLAYDLAVQDARVAVTSAGQRLEHVEVTLDGQPLSLAPMVAAEFRVSPAERATAQRVDLEMRGPVVDSDGDGLPDWWEDAHGTDKWDPADGSTTETTAAPTAAESAKRTASRAARTFAEWRAVHFPTDLRDLQASAAEDADADGVSNLFEYAFDLDPLRAEADGGVASLPRGIAQGANAGLAFRRREFATDLEYLVDASSDLTRWQEVSGEFTSALAVSPGESGITSWRHSDPILADGHAFYRLRLVWH